MNKRNDNPRLYDGQKSSLIKISLLCLKMIKETDFYLKNSGCNISTLEARRQSTKACDSICQTIESNTFVAHRIRSASNLY